MRGTYSSEHDGVDIVASRDDIRGLERKIADGYLGDIPLAVPPASELLGGRQPLATLRISRRVESRGILLRRECAVVEIGGDQEELARVIGGALSGLAEMSSKVLPGSVPTHVHLDPTGGRPYAPESTIEIAFHPRTGRRPATVVRGRLRGLGQRSYVFPESGGASVDPSPHEAPPQTRRHE